MPTCKTCSQPFEIRPDDRPVYEKFGVPAPRSCPDCRLQQRLVFRNERTLYRRPSALSGENVISIYAPESPYVVYGTSEWWSDKWDATTYGRPIDFQRPFFEQLQELRLEVPRIALFNVNPFNSDYCQQAYDNKDCYLAFVIKDCENSMYVTHANKLRDCYDSSHLQNSELCYDCLDSEKLYGCVSAFSCQNSADLYFCSDCIGCQECLFSTGLRNKRLFAFNKPVSKDEFARLVEELRLDTPAGYRNAAGTFEQFASEQVHRENKNLNTEECVGNYLVNAKGSYECFDAFQIEDCAYSTWIFESRDCYDIYGMGTSEMVYFSLGVEALNFAAFNTFVSHCNDAFYSDLCFNSRNIFGCAGLRRKDFCILNRQYRPDEYETLRDKLIDHMKSTGEWGEFFPVSMTPFAYNETAAQEYFPLSPQEAQAGGFRWKPAEKKSYQPQNIQLPESTHDVDAAACKAVLACSSCKKNYRLMPPELEFYRKLNLSVPRECHDCRYMRRMWQRNPRKLWTRKCDRCNRLIHSTYAPARPEKIFCEGCYQEVTQ